MAFRLAYQPKSELSGCFLNRFLAAPFTRLWRRASLSMRPSRVIFTVMAVALTAPVLAAQKVELSVDVAKTGPASGFSNLE